VSASAPQRVDRHRGKFTTHAACDRRDRGTVSCHAAWGDALTLTTIRWHYDSHKRH